MFFGHSAFSQLYTIAALIFLVSSIRCQDCNTADGNREGYYFRTLFGAFFISHIDMHRSWKGAVDECCARGGYLATFLDADFDDFIRKAVKKHNITLKLTSAWLGAKHLASEGNAVWCLPSGDREPVDSLLSSMNIIEAENTNMLCAQYNVKNDTSGLIDCVTESGFICKIEIFFPESCFNPNYNIAESILQIKIIPSALDNEENPGTPFYFKCHAKQYMVIMAEFHRVEADKHCKEKGLQLLSIETTADMDCIIEFFNGTMSSSYWTSGVNYGTKNTTTYGWCSTGKMVDAKQWAEGQPRDPEGNRCVALTIMEDNRLLSGLEPVYCAFLLPLICQIP